MRVERAAWGLVLLAAVLIPGRAQALNPQRSIDQYAHESFGAKDGLPDGAVYSIRETSDGFLWLGTLSSLARFDGQRFVTFEEGELGVGHYSHVRDLYEAPDGSLYAALAGGVARLYAGRFEFHDEREGLEHPFIYALAPGPPGSIWVGSGGAGVWQLRGQSFTRHPAYTASPSLSGQINDMVVSPAGELWVATNSGVLQLGNRVRRWAEAEGLPSLAARVLIFDRKGELWVGTRGGLAHLVGERFRAFTTRDGLSHDDVSALLEDRDGSLWIGTNDGGLNRRLGGRIEQAAPGSAPVNDGVLALAEDRSGALWVGTGHGLERYRSGAFVTVDASAGFGNDEILNVAARPAGGLWVLDGSGAVSIYENGRARPIAKSGTIAGGGMLGLLAADDGSLWVGGQKLHHFADGHWQTFARDGGEFAIMLPDSRGLLIAQTAADGTSTLSHFEDGAFTPIPTPERIIHAQRLYRDGQGRVWISTGGTGLLRIGRDGTRVFRAKDGLPNDVVYGQVEDELGDLWVATRKGLARIRGEQVSSLTAVAGLPRRAPLHVQLDGLGFLWLTADDGIYRVPMAELRAAADGRGREVSAERFTITDGLRSQEMSWRCSGHARTPDGRLWYASARGLSMVDPRVLERDSGAPPIRIEDLMLGSRRAELAEASAIGAGRERIEIRYTAPSLIGAKELEFRYRLVGYDPDWVEARARRLAFYTGLPAGDYTFEVAVRRGGGTWSAMPTELRLRILPRWNETTLAKLLYVLLAAIALAGLYRFRVRRMHVQKQVLIRRVAERTTELNAEVVERRNAEAEVRRLNTGLEERVRDRTTELETANVALAADVVSRQRAEAALADEKEKLAVTLGSIAEGVVTVDVEANVLTMNPVAERLAGRTSAEAARKPLSEVFPLVDRLTRGPLRQEPLAAALAGRGGGDSEVSRVLLTNRDGRQIVVDASAAPIHDRQGLVVGAVLVFRDVTERTRIDEQIQKTQQLEAVGILAGGIAHDFNNLLTGIFGHVDLARGTLPAGSPALRWLDDVLETLDSARGLARQLLTFASGGTPATASHSLRELLDRSARFVLSGSGVLVEVSIPDDLWRCDIDPLQIRQVVDNLVLNARQALAGGGHVWISARNTELGAGQVAGLPPGRYVEVAIADDGPGIPDTVRDRIFDPFFTTKPGGTGLGLATVRSIVMQHGGTVHFQSTQGAGTTFRVLLRATAVPAEPARPAPVTPRAAPGRARGRILVMDDEPQIRNLLEMGLGLEGYDVATSSEGNEAIELHALARAEGRPFELVILDLTVAGGLGGVDTLAKLRAADPKLRAIASSGYSRDDTLADPATSGFDGILPKPYKLSDLADVVAKVLGERAEALPATESRTKLD